MSDIFGVVQMFSCQGNHHRGDPMEMERTELTVKELLNLYKEGMLRVNPEYQRGAVWSRTQQRKLIDSVLRQYPLPLIYLHYIKKTVAGMQSEHLEVVDGQQRIKALYEFGEGVYTLFDPVKDDKDARFPNFIKAQPCPWARSDYAGLTPELRERLEETRLSVVRLTTDNENEVRDLFIRLQAGLPLNAQETRDAWPGSFTDFILKLGGKPTLTRYPGHGFFTKILGMKGERDRGKARQLAAQVAMLYLTRRERGADAFIDINSRAISDFYYSHLDFDPHSADATRLLAILDRLEELLGGTKRPKLKGHDALHLVLLVDQLWDDYAPVWQDSLPEALDAFLHGLAQGKRTKDSATPTEYWTQYGQWTRVNSDRHDRIAHRHGFYVAKMLEFLSPLPKKDPQRIFGALERELIYFREKKRCQVCGGTVAWADAEIHHVVEHQQAGPTSVDNGALVHRECHPKGKAATQSFQSKVGPVVV